MKKKLKRVFIVLLGLVLLLQLYPRAKNNQNGSETKHLSTVLPLPENVKGILQSACYDCHSNNTVYPWYYNVQPLAWWLDDHIEEGKRKLNFSEFAGYNLARQYHKLEEVEELVEEGAMPLKSYTLTHGDAKLSNEEKMAIINWGKTLREQMRAKHPADSLIRKKAPAVAAGRAS